MLRALLSDRDLEQEFGVAVSSPLIRALVLSEREKAELEAAHEGVEAICGDLRDAASLGEFLRGAQGALLIHAAGVIHPRRTRDFHTINVVGTERLLEGAVSAGVQRAVAVSSSSAFGFNPHAGHRFDEDSAYAPYGEYGRSKMRMELIVRRRQEAGELETVVVRCPWFYGPYQPARQTAFFRMICHGRAPLVGRGENLRSMVYTDNLCHGILLAAASAAADGQAYWIADARPYSMREIVLTVRDTLVEDFDHRCGSRAFISLPDAVSRLARVADGLTQSLGFHVPKIHVLAELNRTIACSVRKARRELGYRPRVSLREGIRRSFEWLFSSGSDL